jgi:cell division cycle 20-like protein 1 (cofactor of APC complex)
MESVVNTFEGIGDSCPFEAVSDACEHRAMTDTHKAKKLFRDSNLNKIYSPSPNGIKETLGDRFIPCRACTNLNAKFMAEDDGAKHHTRTEASNNASDNVDTTVAGGSSRNNSGQASGQSSNGSNSNVVLSKEEQQLNSYSQLLKSQILGYENDSENIYLEPCSSKTSTGNEGLREINASKSKKNIFRFKNEIRRSDPSYASNTVIGIDPDKLFPSDQIMFQQTQRKINKAPFKVLDAPQLQDDFYLNLVDWSSQNLLSVGLGPSVYIWSACNSKVTKLCDVNNNTGDIVTSVSWSQRGTHLAIGVNSGETQIWDIQQLKQVRTMGGHLGRVSVAAWNNSLVSTGSRDRTILQHDVRAQEDFQQKLLGHKQEVCGLKWSFDGQQLASGGNDNKLFLWTAQSESYLAKFSDHQAAVKAIAWSPHQRGLLASGGGTADRSIKFWNTLTLECVKSLDTGSQVCNLMFSRNVNELVSTHGYSLNQIIVWHYPQMTKVATLTGHTYRVLYLSMSPDGESIVTGAGDETLRFWNVFPPLKSKSINVFGCSSGLIPASMNIR